MSLTPLVRLAAFFDDAPFFDAGCFVAAFFDAGCFDAAFFDAAFFDAGFFFDDDDFDDDDFDATFFDDGAFLGDVTFDDEADRLARDGSRAGAAEEVGVREAIGRRVVGGA